MNLGIDVSDYKSVRHPVAAVSKDYPHGHETPVHRHTRAQLVCAMTGVMTITCDAGTVVVPPNRAVWIPERADHKVRMSGKVSMRSLYIHKDWPGFQSSKHQMLNLSPLTRELIKEATRLLNHEGPSPRYVRVIGMLRDQLCAIDQPPLVLPMPEDGRVRKVTDSLLNGTLEDRSIKEWARAAGASVRNLRRLFVRETGMSFARWRQQARLLEALRRLADGQSVTQVASEVGYESASAFISAFKKETGVTPRQYFQAAQE